MMKRFGKQFWRNKVAMGTVAGAIAGAVVALPVTNALAASNGDTTNATVPTTTSSTTAGVQNATAAKHLSKHGREIKVKLVRELAAALHVTPQQLKADIKDGQSLQDIAKAHGQTMTEVEQTMKIAVDKAANQRVDGWVSKHWTKEFNRK